jgi:hypothetical protein
MTPGDVAVISAKLESVLDRIDELHRELRDDIHEIRSDHGNTKQELSDLRLEASKLRGAVGVVIFVVPLMLIAVQYVLR